MDPETYRNLTYDKDVISNHCRKKYFLITYMGNTGEPLGKRENWIHTSHQKPE